MNIASVNRQPVILTAPGKNAKVLPLLREERIAPGDSKLNQKVIVKRTANVPSFDARESEDERLVGLRAMGGRDVTTPEIRETFRQFESRSGVRIGVFVLDPKDNTYIDYRANERFPMASTFKTMLVAAVLKKAAILKKDAGHDLMKKTIQYRREDIVFHSPVTGVRLNQDGNGSMTVEDLIDAVQRTSDNTAANLLTKELGGPEAINQYARSLGDKKFYLVNYETNLNAVPNKLDDTSTPAAMALSLKRTILDGDTHEISARENMRDGLLSSITGHNLFRAGASKVSKDWAVGDRSGLALYGTRNDYGLAWLRPKLPGAHDRLIVFAIYTTRGTKDAKPSDEVVADVAGIIADWFQKKAITQQLVERAGT